MKDLTKAELTAHERRVAEFMREVRTTNPEHTSLVESKYPVLTEYQMQRRRRIEVPMGLMPYVGMSASPYSRRSNENRRTPHPAD
jgi:hypothetical protein